MTTTSKDPRRPEGLSDRDRAILERMNTLMWIDAVGVGKIVVGRFPGRGSNYQAVGTGVLVHLRKRGLVLRMLEEGMWRITPAGRLALTQTPDLAGGDRG